MYSVCGFRLSSHTESLPERAAQWVGKWKLQRKAKAAGDSNSAPFPRGICALLSASLLWLLEDSTAEHLLNHLLLYRVPAG